MDLLKNIKQCNEHKIEEFTTVSKYYRKSSDGNGYMIGSGDASGYGYIYGYGYGDGSSSGNGDDNGNGDGCGFFASGNGVNIVEGNGDGGGTGTGYGYENGYGNGHTYVYGFSEGIKKINNLTISTINSVNIIITNIKGNIAKGFILNDDLTTVPTYVVKHNNYFAHGDTVKRALHNLECKAFNNLHSEEKLEKFNNN